MWLHTRCLLHPCSVEASSVQHHTDIAHSHPACSVYGKINNSTTININLNITIHVIRESVAIELNGATNNMINKRCCFGVPTGSDPKDPEQLMNDPWMLL